MKPLTKAQLEKFLTKPMTYHGLTAEQLAKADNLWDIHCNGCGVLIKTDHPLQKNLNHIRNHPFVAGQQECAIYFVLKHFGTKAIEVFLDTRLQRFLNLESPLDSMVAFDFEATIDFLISDQARYKKPLANLTKQYPFAILSHILSKSPSRNTSMARYLMEVLAKHPQWEQALREHCDESQIKVLDRLMIADSNLAVAETQDLPHWLTRVQPWENKKTKITIPDIVITPLDTAPVYQWRAKDELGENGSFTAMVYDEFRQFKDPQSYRYKPNLAEYFPIWGTQERALYLLGFKPARIERILQTGDFTLDDWQEIYESKYRLFGTLIQLDKALALKILTLLPLTQIGSSFDNNPSKLLKWLGDDFLPLMLKFLSPQLSNQSFDDLSPVGWYGFAPYFAQAFCTRWQKDNAEWWLKTYPKQAIHGLLPVAFDSKHKNYRHAQRALIFLLSHLASSYRNIAEQEVAKYPKDLQEAVQFLLENPPFDNSLDKAPTLPQNLHLASLPPLILRQTGNAIPSDYIKPLLQLFTPTKVNEPSQAVTDIKDIVTEQSLATFALELYQWYEAQGRPSKYRWMYALQGHVGNDETARHLAAACKRYRQELNRIGAYDAITMLSQIGTDAAIMYINSFDEQNRYGDLAYRAAVALSNIAKERELTRDELADRTVPDLGLDFNGKMLLDFGTRKFTVSFNELLEPQLLDETGKKLKTLPKPNSKDDTMLAQTATQTFKELKKQIKSVASLQIKRLERAMCEQRRWDFADFDRFFVQHPLMRNLAQRLAWGMFDKKHQLVSLCRITEELTLTDSHDDDINTSTLAEQGYQFGILHRLEMIEQKAGEFGQLLQDYQLIQPFEQLARQTFIYQKSDTNAKDNQLLKWVGKKITVGSILGLEQRGWIREVGEEGMIYQFQKYLAQREKIESNAVSLWVEEGWFVAGGIDTSQVEEIREISLAHGTFAELNPIVYSKIQRDLHLLAWFE